MIDSFDTLGLPLTFRFGSIAAKTGAMISHWSLVKSILQFRYQETELKAREIHYPHGFGLLSTFEIRSIEEVRKEVNAWQKHKNNKSNRISWQFTTKDARIKLKKLYPSIHS